MVMLVSKILISALGAWAAFGLLFAGPFLVRGLPAVDPVAADSGWGFRLLLLPGIVAFWPLLAWRWASGHTAPMERNAHRTAAEVPR